jgi:hypothetical protein
LSYTFQSMDKIINVCKINFAFMLKF